MIRTLCIVNGLTGKYGLNIKIRRYMIENNDEDNIQLLCEYN